MNIPGSVSDTGKFRRRYFDTREEAEAECRRLREIHLRLREGVMIDPALAQDAIAATELLAGSGISLTQAAKFYVEAQGLPE